MTSRFRELLSWELQDNWAFPILEVVVAITIVQVMSITSFRRGYGDLARPFFDAMPLVIVISAAIAFGRSFGEGIEKRKFVVLLSYPVSRIRLFASKYLANLLTTFIIFGSVLLAEGVSMFMFVSSSPNGIPVAGGVHEPVVWALMFLYLFLAVFFTASLMTFIALAVKRFGLSILIFLIYMFGTEYWLSPPKMSNRNPLAYLTLDWGPFSSVNYAHCQYLNWLHILDHAGTSITQLFFLTTLGYMLGGGLILFFASLFLMNRIDLD